MMRLALVVGTVFFAVGCTLPRVEAASPPLETVSYVDLSRYVGKWYEIASFPQSFQKGCTGTTATYTVRNDGKIDVLNRCRLNSLDGKLKEAKGKAVVKDKTTNAKLDVTFFWPFSGKYWVIELSPDYEYAVIGHPDRNYLWILSRTPHMSPVVYDELIDRLQKKHFYDTSKLVRTLQWEKEEL